MFSFVKKVFNEFSKDKGGQMAAAFAYVAVFSIGPLLLVLVSIVGFIYGKKAASGQLFGQLSGVVGPDTARTLLNLVGHTNHTSSGVIALIFGVIGLLLGAGGLTGQLQNAFDAILRAAPDPKAGIKFTVYTRLKNITVVMIAAVVAVASVVLTAAIAKAGKGIRFELLNAVVSWVVFVAMLYLIYRVLPDIKIPRVLVLKTAVLVSLLFLAGKIILGWVIGRNGTASAYGAAASLIALLLWFYYTAQILLLGAEGIKARGESLRLDFPPKRFAIKLKVLDVYNKHDFRGRLLQAFARGYKSKSH